MRNDVTEPKKKQETEENSESGAVSVENGQAVPEIGGRKNGRDPTRYGDWEMNGRCIDF